MRIDSSEVRAPVIGHGLYTRGGLSIRRGLSISSLLAVTLLAGGCSTPPGRGAPPASPAGVDVPSRPAPRTGTGRSGGFYKDDGPGERQAADLAILAATPDPIPFLEPLHPRANRPYRVMGNDYRPMTRREPFIQQGMGSWYGRMFHGRPTSIGERYDMYRMTAAHPTLPIPSFARVTNMENGRQVVVRVNDRGPFLHDRAIDLSYLAAYKLGYVESGSARVQVELLDPAAPGARPAESDGPVAAAAAARAPSTPVPAAPAPAATPAQNPAQTQGPASQSAGHYLQLGAFSSRDNADAASRRLRRDLDWLQAPIRVSSSGVIHRVQAGPFPARDTAARAGALIEESTGLRPMLVLQ